MDNFNDIIADRSSGSSFILSNLNDRLITYIAGQTSLDLNHFNDLLDKLARQFASLPWFFISWSSLSNLFRVRH